MEVHAEGWGTDNRRQRVSQAGLLEIEGSLLIAIIDTSSIELRVSLSGRNTKTMTEMRLGLSLLRLPSLYSSRLALRPTARMEAQQSLLVLSAGWLTLLILRKV